MPASDPPTEITLKIKVPPGYLPPHVTPSPSDSEQFTLGLVPVTTTIGALRNQIQTVIPTHPPPERQRILYGGRALVDDEQSVGDALNVKRDPTQGEYVVHVLVRGEGGERQSRIPTPNSMAGRNHRPTTTTPSPNTAGGPHLGQQQQQQRQQTQPTDQHQQHMHHNLAMLQHLSTVAQQHTNALRQQGASNVGPAVAQDNDQRPPQGTVGVSEHMSQHASLPAPNGSAPSPHVQQMPQPPQPPFPQIPFQPQMGPGFHMEGVTPDGQRFQFHQQTVNIPNMPFPGAMPPMPFNMPAAMPPLPVGNIPGSFGAGPWMHPQMPTPRNANVPSALDQARENIGEMRRMLDELANQSNTDTEEQRRRNIEDMQRRARSVNEYIDPLSLGNGSNVNGTTAEQRPPPVAVRPQAVNPLHAHIPRGRSPQASNQYVPGLGAVTTDQTTAYLLSGPQGPHAILFSPEHGAYTGAVAATGLPRPTPTITATNTGVTTGGNGALPGHAADVAAQLPAAAGIPADPMAEAARLVDGANVQAAPLAGNADAQGPVGFEAILGHFWLLFRILVFAYFILGSNTGWSRIMILAGIGVGFMIVRMGALGDIGFLRRWWEGVMGMPLPPANGQAGPNAAAIPAGQDGARPPYADMNPRQPMPSPEQVAQRLLNEADARQQEQQGWLRGQLRAVERAAALFVASLWPGIGEGYVREQRRVREEQEAAEARRRTEDQARAAEGNDQKDRASAGEGSVSGTASIEGKTSSDEAAQAQPGNASASS